MCPGRQGCWWNTRGFSVVYQRRCTLSVKKEPSRDSRSCERRSSRQPRYAAQRALSSLCERGPSQERSPASSRSQQRARGAKAKGPPAGETCFRVSLDPDTALVRVRGRGRGGSAATRMGICRVRAPPGIASGCPFGSGGAEFEVGWVGRSQRESRDERVQGRRQAHCVRNRGWARNLEIAECVQ